MRKILATILAIAMLLALVACGQAPTISVIGSTTPSQAAEATSTEDAQEPSAEPAEIKTFSMPAPDLIDELMEYCGDQLSGPEVLDGPSIDTTVTVYSIGDYADLYIYKSTFNGELSQGVLSGRVKKIDTDEKINILHHLLATFVLTFEPDLDTAANVGLDLDFPNDSMLIDGTIDFTTGSIASFDLTSYDGVFMMTAKPL